MIQMNTMLAAGSTINNMKTLGKMRSEMKGQSGVLNAEIKSDKSRGLDTSDKEDALNSLQQKMGDLYQKMADLSKTMTDASAEDEKEAKKEEEEGKTTDGTTSANTATSAASPQQAASDAYKAVAGLNAAPAAAVETEA